MEKLELFLRSKSFDTFDSYSEIKDCWSKLMSLYDNGKAELFGKGINDFGLEDVFIYSKGEGAIYIISKGIENEIKKIVRVK